MSGRRDRRGGPEHNARKRAERRRRIATGTQKGGRSRSGRETTLLARAARAQILALLGGRCRRCSFSDARALQIDHVDGGGKRDAGKGGLHYYRRVLKSLKREEIRYQLLCANCNWIKRAERGEHGGEYGVLRYPTPAPGLFQQETFWPADREEKGP